MHPSEGISRQLHPIGYIRPLVHRSSNANVRRSRRMIISPLLRDPCETDFREAIHGRLFNLTTFGITFADEYLCNTRETIE